MVVGCSEGRIPVDARSESPFFFFLLLLSSSSFDDDDDDERRSKMEDAVLLVVMNVDCCLATRRALVAAAWLMELLAVAMSTAQTMARDSSVVDIIRCVGDDDDMMLTCDVFDC